jgi:glyoxylase-like metal-dependent hydrolase (beta-lactamase superfamily II)
MNNYFLYGLMLSAVLPVAADDNVFAFRVGDFEVWTLVESRRPGGIPTNLVGADQAAISRYFPDGTSDSQTNAFLIRGNGHVVLVDTGFGTLLFDSMRTLNISPDDVDAILITHLHGDHTGGLQKDGKALFPKAKIYISGREYDFFTKTNVNQGAVAALAPYAGKIVTFTPGEIGARIAEILPGITPIESYGHTPGHVIYMLESGGQRLLIAGDMVHVQKIQFAMPNIAVTYDSDPAAAIASRLKALNYAVSNNVLIAGMHLTGSAVGRVSRDGGGFTFSPY